MLRARAGGPGAAPTLPRTYEDDQDEAAYRELMGDELLNGRRRALQRLAETADAERLSAEAGPGVADGPERPATRAGHPPGRERGEPARDLPDDDPRAPDLALYAYLSWLQEQVIEAMAGNSR